MSAKKITSTSRGAFLTSDWIEFQKQLYASEEKIETQFKKDWKSNNHAYQKNGNRITQIHEKADKIPPKAHTHGPRIRSKSSKSGKPRQQDVVLGLIAADGGRLPTPFYADDHTNDRWARSPRADAQVDQSVVNQLKEHRWSKKNREHDKMKFSKSSGDGHVSECLDFNGARRDRDELLGGHVSGRLSRMNPTGKIGETSSRKQSRAPSRAPSRAQSRASATGSRSSSRGSNGKIKLENSTIRAFCTIRLRMDERVGLSHAKQRLFMKNCLRKYAVEGSNHMSLKQFTTFLDSLGCGAGAVNLKAVCQQFREDKPEMEAVNFSKLMNSYLDFRTTGR